VVVQPGRDGVVTGSRRALLIDYGGVLTERIQRAQEQFCVLAGIDPRSLAEVLRAWVECPDPDSPAWALERGELPVPEFERLLAGRLRRWDGAPVPHRGLLRRLFTAPELNDRMLTAVRVLRARGVRTALVSNAWGTEYPFERLGGCFDRIVLSNRIGARKPEPRIYLHSAELLGVEPAECVFVDDRSGNVDGAVAVGMRGVHFVDSATALAQLSECFGEARRGR
jgi:epoxide hydrolase-like predicted phosphatase